LIQQIKSFERTVVEAAITGDYNTAMAAVTINPLVPSQHTGKILLDEMLEAHKAYLPNFKAYFDAE
jgi:6-phospho-beta-glucosidase